MARVFIGIGSNLGDRRGHLELARRRLGEVPRTHLVAFSPIYETDPVGPVQQEAYLNAVAELATALPPRELLTRLRQVEAEAGRAPLDRRVRWGPRELDLDILLYGDAIVSEGDLAIPHPHLHERWFVLRPLADLAPEMVHPVLARSVADLLREVEGSAGVAGRRA